MEDRGGLNYVIDVSGSFDAKLDSFLAKVQRLDAAVESLGKRAATAGAGGTESKKAASLEKRQRDLLKKTEQHESQREQKRLKKLEQTRIAQIRRTTAAAKKAEEQIGAVNAKFARARNKELTQQGDIQRRNASQALKAAILERDKVKSSDAKKTSKNITAAETKERKKALAILKEDILERDRSDKQRLATGARAISSAEAEVVATQRNGKAANELAIKKAQILQVQRSMNVSQRRAAELVGVSSTQAKQMGLNMWDAEHAARQFLFTFRRLVGILAIFTAARKFAQAIGAAVGEISRFNSELETAEIGIASIVASVGQVRDSTGALVTGAEAFAGALGASKKIMRELKMEAIGSIATFEALVKSYQVAIGPGLAAGLDLNQIKDVSKRLAEGAITLGVPLNQLSEEIRSLLQGTATARNTRIAVLFGGAKEANESIRNAKEMGNLYEVLIERLQGIAQGASAATSSFNVLKSDLQDAVQLLLAEGGIEYFNQLKESLFGLRSAITEVDKFGEIGFTPEALGVVQEMSGAMAEVIASFRSVSDTSQVFILLRGVLATIGDVLKALAPLASAVFQGLVTGINLALAPLRFLMDALRALARLFDLQKLNKGLAQTVKYLIAGVVALKIWHKLLVGKVLRNSVAALALNFKKILALLIAMSAVQKDITANQVLLTITTKGWAGAWALVNTSALATFGIVVAVAGALAFLVVHFKLLERFTGLFNRNLTEADQAAKELRYAISSAGDETAEGARSAKEWHDEFLDMERDLVKAKGLKGLTDTALEYGELIQESIKELSEGTEQWTTINDQIDKNVAKLQEELELLEAQKKELGEIADIGFDTAVPLWGGAGENLLLSTEENELQDRISERTQLLVQAAAARKQNEDKIAEALKKQLELLDLQVKILKQKNPPELLSAQLSAAEAEANARLVEIVKERMNVTSRIVAERQVALTLAQAEFELASKERTIELDSAEANARKARELGASLEVRKGLEQEVLKLKELQTYAEQTEEASLAEQTRELERQKDLLAGDFTAGLSEGLETFVEDLPALGQQLADTITGALSDFAGVVGSVFKDAIDPRKDADLRTAFGEFFLNLAGQFVEMLASQAITGLLSQIGFGAVKDVATVANTTSTTLNTTALSANTLALGGLHIPIAGLSVSLNASIAAIVANTAALTTNSAVSAFSRGGLVRGYVSGGSVAENIPRPRRIPASDTIPAWLTPGEGILNVSAMKTLGVAALNALNRGVLNPASFGGTIAPILSKGQRGIRSFAQGGSTGDAARARLRGGRTIIMPVYPTTEDNMDKMIAGGRASFQDNVNKMDIVGDPNRSNSWGT